MKKTNFKTLVLALTMANSLFAVPVFAQEVQSNETISKSTKISLDERMEFTSDLIRIAQNPSAENSPRTRKLLLLDALYYTNEVIHEIQLELNDAPTFERRFQLEDLLSDWEMQKSVLEGRRISYQYEAASTQTLIQGHTDLIENLKKGKKSNKQKMQIRILEAELENLKQDDELRFSETDVTKVSNIKARLK